MSGVFFYFYFICDSISCEQTAKTLIRRRVLRRLIWVCTVCLCPKNGTLGLYGLRWSSSCETRIHLSSSCVCTFNSETLIFIFYIDFIRLNIKNINTCCSSSPQILNRNKTSLFSSPVQLILLFWQRRFSPAPTHQKKY